MGRLELCLIIVIATGLGIPRTHADRVTRQSTFSGVEQEVRATVSASADVRVHGTVEGAVTILGEVCLPFVGCTPPVVVDGKATIDHTFSLAESAKLNLDPSGQISFQFENLDPTTLADVNPAIAFPGRSDGLPTVGDFSMNLLGSDQFVLDLPSRTEEVDVAFEIEGIPFRATTEVELDFDPVLSNLTFEQADESDFDPGLFRRVGSRYFTTGIPGAISGTLGGDARVKASIDLPLIGGVNVVDERFSVREGFVVELPSPDGRLRGLPGIMTASQAGTPLPDQPVDATFTLGLDPDEDTSFDFSFTDDFDNEFSDSRRFEDPSCCFQIGATAYDIDVSISNSDVTISEIAYGIKAEVSDGVVSAMPPEASFAEVVVTVMADDPIVELASTSIDPEGGPLEYSYAVDDRILDLTGPHLAISLDQIGFSPESDSVAVQLTVTDSTQQTDAANATVEYVNSRPAIANASGGRIGRFLQFNADVLDPDLSVNELIPDFERLRLELDSAMAKSAQEVGDGIAVDLPTTVSLDELVDVYNLSGDVATLYINAVDRFGAIASEELTIDLRLLGDTDLDGLVQLSDLVTQQTNWTGALSPGEGAKTEGLGDIDGDGDVDTVDGLQLVLNWSSDLDDAVLFAVPEPDNKLQMTLAGLFLLSLIYRSKLLDNFVVLRRKDNKNAR